MLFPSEREHFGQTELAELLIPIYMAFQTCGA